MEERRREHRGEIVIRAREASALEALREVAPTLTPTVIYGDSDYRYRAWLGREEWADALAEIGRRVAYSNFKSECPAPAGGDNSPGRRMVPELE